MGTTDPTNISWPAGKRFAFTVFDDTDRTTLVNGPPVYEFLHEQGFHTTKSVWPVKGERTPLIGGTTCKDQDYLLWVQKLREQGFEIALHNVTYHTSTRVEIVGGLAQFKTFFGSYPAVHVNHEACRDAVYWGDARLSGANKLLYNFFTRFRKHGVFQGHVANSDVFWGDVLREKIRYVRNFVYSDVNTLRACPYMPYFDPDRPYVNNWFASSEGADVHSFNKTISERNQETLEEEGGACIMYTHFGKAFFQDGSLHPTFKRLMERLSRRSGWFVPVSTLLDHIIRVRGQYSISALERYKLELKWLINRMMLGGTR
ncbi:MAG: hypothetical protein V1798_04080 [Pseudomonadota bacterium]